MNRPLIAMFQQRTPLPILSALLPVTWHSNSAIDIKYKGYIE